MKLSDAEPVAVRLDARAMESNGALPGKPLIECVEVLDARYDRSGTAPPDRRLCRRSS